MKVSRGLLALALFIPLALVEFATPALAEKRIGLVIGNNTYPNLPADKQLTNAISDARAMREALKGLGFDIIYGENLDRRSMVDRLFDLAARLGKDDVAFFFFAGHGVSFSGANYLLPVDVPAPRASGRAEEGRLAEQAIAEITVLERITGAGARVAVVVLDACRDNPLQTPDRRSVGSSRGLGRAEPVKGVFSIYSAGFGQQALDRLGSNDRHPNSVFTRVFIEKLKTPGLDLKAVATQTRRKVVELAQTVGHEQFPAYYDQIVGGDVYLAGLPAPPGQTAASSLRADPCAAAEAHWKSTEAIGSKAAFEDHLARFPNCAFAGLARKLVAMIPPAVPVTPPTPMQPAVQTPPTGLRGAFTLEPRTDRPGSDYRNFEIPAPSADARVCEEACQQESRCRAFTYVRPGIQGPDARCWLKSSVPVAKRSDTCCASGVRKRGW